ncbi:hypothetical protein MIT9_P2141 [Methylomarinovum caldicuralii]|uniref:DUF3450 domain-containing protein n=1 Tax=Methylomarinovum caldicuralii TaxID=438856 RepID=A0AAU9C1G4_9GAMM|nr:DUF3450 family protein [Methylomarinovum caldicuralii]BCX82555.1 hypothetical protein MIT9_P2141 [Methylomarinovum caldicuralii]
MKRSIARSFLLTLLLASPVWAADLDRLAERLAKLRAEVDRLQQQIEQTKSEHHQQMDALGAQLAQLEAEKRRQQLTVAKLQHELESALAKIPTNRVEDETLKPVLEQGIAALKDYIRTGLPFKTEDRLQAVAKLEGQLQSGSVPAKKLANRLWALFEDELHLTRENGLYQQIVPIDGDSALVDVAKLGMVMLYFQTPDGRYGLARRQQDGGWRFETLSGGDDQARIAKLMDSLRKQIRQGYFELPNPGLTP